MSFTFDYISHALTSVVWTHKVKKALNSGNTIAAIFKSILPPPAYLQIQGNGLSLTVMTKRYYSDTRSLKALFDTLFTFLVSSGQEAQDARNMLPNTVDLTEFLLARSGYQRKDSFS